MWCNVNTTKRYDAFRCALTQMNVLGVEEDLDSNGCALTLVIFTCKMVAKSNRISILTECAGALLLSATH